ncbi:MAG TPA: nuclear transport factor 2 family protein [Rhizobiaceae bacterium]|nr:nuclear transport factor 2 family protein [Rhizobiaceae bacterium]
MESSVRALFERYERFFNRSLAGDMDMDEVAALYAPEFIAATPAGVMTGKNDDQLRQTMKQGYEHYRAIGTKEMRIRDVRLSPMDDHHCVAHVAWTATYARKDKPDIAIDFDVHYLVQKLDSAPKVFGWVSGDEQALLRKHGII